MIRRLGTVPSEAVPSAISHRAQTAAVDWLTAWTVREIDTLFSSQELPAPSTTIDVQRWAVVGTSVRRELAARYHAAIDSRNAGSRARLLRVYDEMIRSDRAGGGFPARLTGALRADSVRFTEDGLIDATCLAIEATSVYDGTTVTISGLRDPEVLRQHAHRMQRALSDQDPADAILAGRELIEAVCHVVIEDYGESAPKNPSTGALYGQAADLLGLKAGAIEGDTEASKAARQVLQGLMNIAVGMGELRTKAGRGHGAATRSPARQRHAELATNAAGTLALFVLDTWQEHRRATS